MAKNKIVFFETSGWQQEYLQSKLKQYQPVFFDCNIDRKCLLKIKDATVLVVFVGSEVNRATLKSLPRLKFITTMSTGFDHIDLAACRQRGIPVTNVPYYGENTVAEHAMALLLSISRNIHKGYERTNRGQFDFTGLMGFDLKDKTIGIIGTGHIGQHLIRMAKGFDMKVIAYDAFPNKALAKESSFKYMGLTELLKQADIVSLHLPYLKATHHLLNAARFKIMKRGAVLINTARGGLVDTKAMVQALQSGQLSAVGLDVLEDEKYIKEEVEMLSPKFKSEDMRTTIENHMLMHSDNAVITPHMAFNSKEAIIRILDTTVGNIKSFIGSKSLANRVDLKK